MWKTFSYRYDVTTRNIWIGTVRLILITESM